MQRNAVNTGRFQHDDVFTRKDYVERNLAFRLLSDLMFISNTDGHKSHFSGLGPLLSCPVYTATKHGVVGFTRAMAVKTFFLIMAMKECTKQTRSELNCFSGASTDKLVQTCRSSL